MDNNNIGSLDSFLKAFGINSNEARRNVLIVVFMGMIALIVFLFYENGKKSSRIEVLNNQIITIQATMYERIVTEVKNQVNNEMRERVEPKMQKLDTAINKVDSAATEIRNNIKKR